MKKPLLNVCIAGLGRAGRIHFQSIQQIESIRVKYCFDTDTDRAAATAQEFGCEPVALETALQDDDLHAVIVASPTFAHYEQVLRSLEAGKHVFSEKPLGVSLAEVQACYAMAEKNSAALYLGFNRRYDHNFRSLKSGLPEAGDARMVRITSRDNPRPSIDYLKISGNIFHDMLIHDFDMLVNLFGFRIPDTVFAAGHCYDEAIRALGDFDTVSVTLKYPGGMICSIDTSRVSVYGYDQRIEVFGKDGMLIAENQLESTVKVFGKAGIRGERAAHSFPQRYKTAYVDELRDWLAGIGSGKLHNVDRDSCILTHLIADAGMISATENRAVDFRDFYARETS